MHRAAVVVVIAVVVRIEARIGELEVGSGNATSTNAFVDEVNLLADHLVDALLDVAVSGEHRLERDGVSVVHPARFVLVGTMNPEEGELRPQLLDRFGLCVTVRAPDDPATRAQIVRRRLAFDRPDLQNAARLAVLVTSVVAAGLGSAILLVRRRHLRPATD